MNRLNQRVIVFRYLSVIRFALLLVGVSALSTAHPPVARKLGIYLAGPDVFFPEASRLGKKKEKIAAEAGYIGLFPLDNEVKFPTGATPLDKGTLIYQANINVMRSSDLVIANMTPFRGMSMDVGTAFEMGFMMASGKPVLAYSETKGTYRERVEAFYKSKGLSVNKVSEGQFEDPEGNAIENTDMRDNLMLEGAVNWSDSKISNSFEEALEANRKLLSSYSKKDPCSGVSRSKRNHGKKVYLGGPDVFYPHPIERGEKLKALMATLAFDGIFPMDNQIKPEATRFETGIKVFQTNIALMCDSDLMLANMTPFRGPSMDVGTAFEMGFMTGLGKPVFGYSEGKGDLATRVERYYKEAGKPLIKTKSGGLQDPDGNGIEQFTMADNLMLHATVLSSGGRVADNPTEALATQLPKPSQRKSKRVK